MPKTLPPPRFEISDLRIPESDMRHPNAVKCVKMYWKQATHLTEGQIGTYLGYLSYWNISTYVPIFSQTAEPNTLLVNASNHKLYPKFDAQRTVRGRNSWTGYMLLSSLYEQLPSEYLESITERFGDNTIEDRTDEYRYLYPAPTAQQEIAAPVTDTTTPTVDITMSAETSTATTSYAQTVAADASDTWDINSIVETMSLSNKKRLCSGSDSPAKRTKANANELLQKVNQQSEVIQAAIGALQKNQDAKMREMQEAIEENRQALAAMQSELRQFMSAVATTLRGIQERLDE